MCFAFCLVLGNLVLPAIKILSQPQIEDIQCDLLVVGGGISGVATAYEALKTGHTVCLTEITDWLGGQVSSQGTSALDEELGKSTQLAFSQGYLELRQRIASHYGTQNPGRCWVSEVCFFPRDGHLIILAMLQEAAKSGGGSLRWFPKTVIRELQIVRSNNHKSEQIIQSVSGIQHFAAYGARSLNTYPLSQTLEESYSEKDSVLFGKEKIRFLPPKSGRWYVIEATATGEIMALADIPYRVSRQNYEQPYYRQKFSPTRYQALKNALASLGESGMQRTQSTVFPDSVGIGHYPIDIHGCMALSPPERSLNYERPEEKQAHAQTYPFQIPLRAMIPQKIDNLLVTGTNIATSHISAAAYRTQSIEWSTGAAAGMTATFALEQNIWADQLVETLPRKNAKLMTLQQRLRDRGNPIAFPVSPTEWLWKWRLIIIGLLLSGVLLVLLQKFGKLTKSK
ncbi:FAD-dependent oxidoreductase [Calothrix sp. UHCC 0171]|uniref:FAD-dependent oxidoreductase n=1 Tax=Calothrix sp. UHCC 0171 TaxID=3110245 RepID=UPI002B1FD373|nr:FAD-dependent oxidoreductase [Calothrix sp. UHCC 0171]MEA5573702.1 FAD-dependent oxidoreductase [Calothrix sp. UHCC 0171]